MRFRRNYILYMKHWVGWLVAIEAVHFIASVHAAYQPGVGYGILYRNFLDMHQLSTITWVGIVAVSGVLSLGTFYYYEVVARKRHLSSKACSFCGYDLTGLSASEVCPECGRSVSH